MKTISRVFCILLLLLLLTTGALAAEVVTTTETIGGASAQVVYITPSEDTVITPMIANGSVCTDAPVADTIAQASGSVVAAINGNFFNSYYQTSQPMSVMDNNYPRIFSALVRDGKMICSGGSAALGVDEDGQIRIGRVTLKAKVSWGSTYYIAWGVNTVYTEPTAIYVLTDEFDYPVDIPSSSTIVTIEDGKISGIFGGEPGYVTPDGAISMVIGPRAQERQMRVGEAATYSFVAFDGDSDWSEMRNVLGGSGLIVENGCSAVDNNPDVTAPDQDPDVQGLRSFAAVLSDGRLMLGTVYSSYRAIADSLIDKGVTDAMFLDGGGSSMLYANGRYMTSPGRKLASILAVLDTQVTTGASAAEAPSAWAAADLDSARELGILPDSLDGAYRQNITRGEFCRLIAGYLYAQTGTSVEEYCASKGVSIDGNQFSDTRDEDIAAVAALGIVLGCPDGTFKPSDSILRQDAAIMLRRLAETLGVDRMPWNGAYADAASIAEYAKPGVEFVSSLGIMKGYDGNRFGPRDCITREQAVTTIMNTWRTF